MNGMQFSSNVITVLAWPLIILLILVVYRSWIIAGITAAISNATVGRRIKKFKLGPIEFEWFSEISSAGQDLGNALKAMPLDASNGELVPMSLVDLIDDVNKNPRGGIRKAFRLVRKALDESYPWLASVTYDGLSDAIEDLARRGLLHDDVQEAISQLQKLLEMSNSDAGMVDPARGYLFLLLAEGAIHGILRSAEIHASEIDDARLIAGLTPVRSSWQGWYNQSFIIELRMVKWINNSEFEGEMNYPGSGTTTSVTGHIITTGSGNGRTTVTWKENGYVDRGNRSIDFDGKYEAIISGNVMTGNWQTGDQLIGEFELLGR